MPSKSAKATVLSLLKGLRGRRVLVTGHTGFKGSWLSLWLTELGAEVHGVALAPPTRPSLFRSARVAERVSDHRLDIRDHRALRKLVARVRPELILHLAAQPLVRASYAAARETFEVNLMGSVNVFECARDVDSVKALVHVGTDKCYENRETHRGYRESDPLGGHDPYSASKATAEIAFQSYLRSFYGVRERPLAASGRAGNVIGGGDWARDRILPDAMRALAAGRPLFVRNPSSTRPWQHVLEALSGYLVLAAHLLDGRTQAQGSWNFGPGVRGVRTVRDLADQVVRLWGRGEWRHHPDRHAPHEAALLTLDCGKARRELDWRPRWNFATTVSRTVQWYRDAHGGRDPQDLCWRDIRAYMEELS